MTQTKSNSKSGFLTWAYRSLFAKVLVLFAFGFGIYSASLSNQFVMDDEEQIQNNNLTESLDHLEAIFLGASTVSANEAKSYGVYYRPLMLASFAVLRSTFGLDPLPFHLFQLLLHIANSLLLFVLFRRFFPEDFAFVGALLFLIHPMNTEAVSYIAAVQDPLFSFFGLLALNSVMKLKSKASWFYTLGLSLLFLTGLFSKESAALFMFFCLMYVAWRQPSSLIRVGTSICLALFIYLGIRIGLAHLTAINHASTQLARADFQSKLLTLPMILFSYLGKFILPIHLACTQDWTIKSPDFISFWLPAGAVIFMTLICVRAAFRRGLSAFSFFFIWTIAGLGLHSHLITALDGTVAERWFYIPCMGLIGMCLSLLSEKQDALRRHSPVVKALLFVFICFFSYSSFSRSLIWRDGFTLYLNDVELQPDSAHLQNNSAVELMRLGRNDEALGHLQQSVSLNPYWTISWNNLGVAYMRSQDFKKAEECFRRSLSLGHYLLTYQNLAALLATEKRLNEASDFLSQQAIPLFPNDHQLLELQNQLQQLRAK